MASIARKSIVRLWWDIFVRLVTTEYDVGGHYYGIDWYLPVAMLRLMCLSLRVPGASRGNDFLESDEQQGVTCSHLHSLSLMVSLTVAFCNNFGPQHPTAGEYAMWRCSRCQKLGSSMRCARSWNDTIPLTSWNCIVHRCEEDVARFVATWSSSGPQPEHTIDMWQGHLSTSFTWIQSELQCQLQVCLRCVSGVSRVCFPRHIGLTDSTRMQIDRIGQGVTQINPTLPIVIISRQYLMHSNQPHSTQCNQIISHSTLFTQIIPDSTYALKSSIADSSQRTTNRRP